VKPKSRNLLLGLALACLLLALAIAQAPAAAGQPVLLDSPRIWTLRDLGYSDIFMPAGAGTVVYPDPQVTPYRYTDPVKYLLPDGAAQGPDTWYVIHFHFEIEFEEAPEDLRTTVYAMPNYQAVAMIDFTAVKGDDSPTVEWISLSMTDGGQKGTSDSRRIEMQFSNYFPNAGVVPGENSLLFAVKEREGAKVAMLHVFDDTSIEVTPLSPPELGLEVDMAAAGPAGDAGDTFEVPYTVRNVGGWPTKDVVTEVSYPEDALRLLGERSVTTPLLDGAQEVSGSFQFEALSTGPHDIILDAHSKTGGTARMAVTVTITADAGVSKVRLGLLVALVVGLSALPLLPYEKILARIRGRPRDG